MSLATALLTPILGDASPWTPRRLFQLGEAGGVYDPSDLTAEKVAWRRNLLTWSEDFTNAAWTKTRSSITPNAGTSWDGTATASKLVEDTSTNTHILSVANVSVGGTVGDTTPYCFSVYAKAAERTGIRLVDNGQAGLGTGSTYFDLSAGAILSGSGQIVSVGGGWYRCIIFPSRTAGTLANPQVRLLGPGGAESYTGDGTSGVLIDSAQLEASSTATAYQRITDFTSDFLAAFPTHGLYQDAAGTTPVTALGQPVGLVIDSKTGGLANLGPELVNIAALPTPTIANAGGSNGTWTAGTRTMASTVTGTDGGYPRFEFNFGLTANRRYAVSGRLSGNLTTLVGVRLATSGSANELAYSSATGRFSGVQVSAGAVLEFRMNGTVTAPQSLVIEELSVREVPGVHAIQPTNSSRPLLDGRVNLLTRSDEIGVSPWSLTRGTASANVAAPLAPDGTQTADKIVQSAGITVYAFAQQDLISLVAGTYTFSVYARAAERTWLALRTNLTGTTAGVYFNLSTGAIGTTDSGYTASVEAAGNGWYRCSVTATSTTTANRFVLCGGAGGDNDLNVPDDSGGVVVWRADFRLASDNAYPPQRVAAATDYADVGVPRSFAFDGFDDSLYTASNMDLSGTDKVTVLAGVRKLSDAAAAIVCELTPNSSTTSGAFAQFAPASTPGAFLFRSRGTSISEPAFIVLGPVDRVFTGIGEISTDTALLRLNGTQVSTSSQDQGTGNYSSAVLFIGRRNNTSNPFNGKAYQLIVRGALTDTATLAQAERYVGAKTGLAI